MIVPSHDLKRIKTLVGDIEIYNRRDRARVAEVESIIDRIFACDEAKTIERIQQIFEESERNLASILHEGCDK